MVSLFSHGWRTYADSSRFRPSILFGIIYLTFEAWPIIFGEHHGFSLEQTGLAFTGIGVGMMIGTAVIIIIIMYVPFPIARCLYMLIDCSVTQRRYGDVHPPPEEHLVAGMLGALCVPVSLYWLAFTSYAGVHWIVPILASTLFGVGTILCFSSTFTYLVSAYRPLAASAMAANTFARSLFAAAFPLFARQMYVAMGTDGATALLAGVMTVAAPLP